jgi:hypothetical protein
MQIFLLERFDVSLQLNVDNLSWKITRKKTIRNQLNPTSKKSIEAFVNLIE